MSGKKIPAEFNRKGKIEKRKGIWYACIKSKMADKIAEDILRMKHHYNFLIKIIHGPGFHTIKNRNRKATVKFIIRSPEKTECEMRLILIKCMGGLWQEEMDNMILSLGQALPVSTHIPSTTLL